MVRNHCCRVKKNVHLIFERNNIGNVYFWELFEFNYTVVVYLVVFTVNDTVLYLTVYKYRYDKLCGS